MGGSLSKYKQRQYNKTGSGNDLQTKAEVNLTPQPSKQAT